MSRPPQNGAYSANASTSEIAAAEHDLEELLAQRARAAQQAVQEDRAERHRQQLGEHGQRQQRQHQQRRSASSAQTASSTNSTITTSLWPLPTSSNWSSGFQANSSVPAAACRG